MNQPFDDELLSAYLDGELSGDERARVERWLADQHEARQLLDELRSVRRSLAALPAYRLDEDLTERVVRRAERAVLSAEAGQGSQDGNARQDAALQPAVLSVRDAARGADRTAGGNPATTGHATTGHATTGHATTEHATTWSLARLRRPLAYAAVAIAAAVMLMFVQDGGREANRQLPERVAAGGAAIEAAKDAAPRLAVRAGSRDELDRARDAEGQLFSKTAATPVLEDASDAREVADRSADALEARPSLSGAASNMAAGASPVAPPAAARPSAVEGEVLSKSLAASAPAEAPLSEESRTAEFGFPAIEVLDRAALGDVLVVECEITPSAARQQVFQQVLTRNSITFEGAPIEDRDLGETRALAAKEAGAATAGGGFSGARPTDAPASEASLARQEASGIETAERPSDVEIVYVEATAEQLHATLAELAAEQDAFPAVDVQPAEANVAQQAWRGLSRTSSQAAASQSRAFKAGESQAEQPLREAIASQEPEVTDNRRLEQITAPPAPRARYFYEGAASQQADSAARSDAGAAAADDSGGAEPIRAPDAYDDRAGQTAATSRALQLGVPLAQQPQPLSGQSLAPPLQNRSWAQRIISDGQTAQNAQVLQGQARFGQSRAGANEAGAGAMARGAAQEVAQQAAPGELQAAAATPTSEPVTTQSTPQAGGASVPNAPSAPSYQRALFFLRVVPSAE